MIQETTSPGSRAHPVAFDVEYPERLSRLSTAFRLILVLPQLLITYLLLAAMSLLTVIAWFAILFTGRYPRSFFAFTTGALRWQANAVAYMALLRDEYPPFSWEPGEYPLTLDFPPAERQSRFRLFIRIFAIVPNQLVFFFVAVGWYFTTIFAWFAILVTGRYPRGLFGFAVGTMRWYMRQNAYYYLLRDEYPPYSRRADAQPGNEVLSAVVGLPLFVLQYALWFLPYTGVLRGGAEVVSVDAALLDTPGALSRARPAGERNSVRVTLAGFADPAVPPAGTDVRDLSPGGKLIAFDVYAEKDGLWPAFYTPFLFFLKDCFGNQYAVEGDATSRASEEFELWWRDGDSASTVYFDIPVVAEPCELRYFAGAAEIRFEFK